MFQTEAVICGAGIAGVAAAYFLTRMGLQDLVLVERADPLSLTSDKSTEAYRNWWPGPDGQMIAFMNRSIELLEAIAQASHNRIQLNRRGYLYATAEQAGLERLLQSAQTAERQGAGPLREHSHMASYRPSLPQGFEAGPDGADLIRHPALIRTLFPYLNPQTQAVLHVRRAGWLSAQQLGLYLLEEARAQGARLWRGEVVGLETQAGAIHAVVVQRPDGALQTLKTPLFVSAAGPLQGAIGQMLGLELPVFAERHLKLSFSEALGVVPREAPMLIWLDEVALPWSPEEQALLVEDAATRWLLQKLPGGAHCRPDGPYDSPILIGLYNPRLEPVPPVFPLSPDPFYPELTLRALSCMLPELRAYFPRLPRAWVDGGYYLKTPENRPLIGPLPVAGAYILGALSGFGVMAACAAGELLAAHVLGRPLPAYAPAFVPGRYQDPAYQQRLAAWGETAQL
ncbi:NAD(P)/FAD-dependent oxidoreductase [Meiothermus rufus]|uniref:NAD(P)/FAD-dependent oxidoreductase n=1 Tax=Meiothermus rufus TaxID=604332 RepID=UPI000400AD3C|nr:FAD-binding oxidoreductase [Meiothermus rufus]